MMATGSGGAVVFPVSSFSFYPEINNFHDMQVPSDNSRSEATVPLIIFWKETLVNSADGNPFVPLFGHSCKYTSKTQI